MHKFDRTESQCEDFVGCDVGYGALDDVGNGSDVGLDAEHPFSLFNPSKIVYYYYYYYNLFFFFFIIINLYIYQLPVIGVGSDGLNGALDGVGDALDSVGKGSDVGLDAGHPFSLFNPSKISYFLRTIRYSKRITKYRLVVYQRY